MLALFLYAATVLNTRATLDCGAGRRAENSALTSSNGTAYSFVVNSDDDHRKMSHDCESSYSLHIVKADGASHEMQGIGVGTIDHYGRLLSVQIVGFSQDGNRLLGLQCEEGLTYGHSIDLRLIDIDLANESESKTSLVSIPVPRGGCHDDMQVIGTLKDGEVVIQLGGIKETSRWAISPLLGRRRRLSPAVTVIALKASGSR